MSLTSLSFLGLFFPVLLMAYYNPVLKSNSFRKIILFCASIGLYTVCEPIYSLLLIMLIVLNYILVRISDKYSIVFFRGIAIIIDAGTLLLFKYINQFLAFGLLNKDVSTIVFPIGLSYFTFKAISYVVDSKEIKEGSFIDVAIYISNFLTIVSGPLSTYQQELPAIREKDSFSYDNAYVGIERFVLGLAKKVLIADNLSVLVNQAFAADDRSLIMAWGGAIAYTLQLYFDFSGYTDMAIGIGSLFGFSLPENFNFPYMATSISDFWKRWHMSLTKWFTRYIYIPLGGSRVKTAARHIFNLFVVWVVTGIWHGSNMTFIVWALIYFLLQMLEKYTNYADVLNKLHVGHLYTMVVVIIEWVIFRSSNLGAAWEYVKSMFMLTGNTFYSSYDLQTIAKFLIPLLLGVSFSTCIGLKIRVRVSKNICLNSMYNFILLTLLVVCIVIIMSKGYTAPLYAGF